MVALGHSGVNEWGHDTQHCHHASSSYHDAMSILRRPVLLVSVIALLVRVIYCLIAVFVFHKAAPGGFGHDGYLEVAQNLVAGRGYQLLGEPNYFRPPTYVLFLVPWVTLPGTHFWILAAQSVVGAATCGLVTFVARFYVTVRIAILSGMALAFCPWHVHFTANSMSYLLVSFLTMGFLAIWLHQIKTCHLIGSLGSGVLYGLMLLCHPGSAIIGPMWMLDRIRLDWRNRRLRACLGLLATFIVGTFLIVSPWMIRNRISSGEWIPLTNATGFQYFISDQKIFSATSAFSLPGRETSQASSAANAALVSAGLPASETLTAFKGVGIEQGKFFSAWMMNDIREHPGKWPRRLFQQGWWFWFGDSPRLTWLHFVYKVPLLCFAMLGCWRGYKRRMAILPLVCVVLAYWSVHAAIMGFIPHAAYCLSVMGPVCILAGIGLMRIPEESGSTPTVS